MYNRTELTDAILKSKKAREILGWMPQVYGDAYAFLWLLEVIGAELEEMEGWSQDLKNQVVPQTATWSLPYWEERYGIPVNPEAPLKKRRAEVILRMWQRAPMNPAKLENMLSGVTGLPAAVLENTGKNHFTIEFDGYNGLEDFRRAVDIIERVKPAHLIYTLRYLLSIWLQIQMDYCVGITFTMGVTARGPENLGYKKILLDGTRILDGSWKLGGYEQIYDSAICYLDGSRQLDGSWELNGYQQEHDGGFYQWNGSRQLDGSWKLNGWEQEHNRALDQWNGSRQLDGTWRLSGYKQELDESLYQASIQCSAKLEQKADYAVELEVRKNLWKLDGTVRLDGTRKLNADNYFITL